MPILHPNLKYTPTHEWIYLDEDEIATIGITDYAQENLGEVTFIELPISDNTITKGEVFGVIESVNADSDLYSPLSGTIIEVNPDLDSNPALINESPYQFGWLIRMHLSNKKELDTLLDLNTYQKLC